MSLTEILLLSVPAVLVAFKLAALSLAAVWAARAVFEHNAPLPVVHRDGQRTPVGSRSSRG